MIKSSLNIVRKITSGVSVVGKYKPNLQNITMSKLNNFRDIKGFLEELENILKR